MCLFFCLTLYFINLFFFCSFMLFISSFSIQSNVICCFVNRGLEHTILDEERETDIRNNNKKQKNISWNVKPVFCCCCIIYFLLSSKSAQNRITFSSSYTFDHWYIWLKFYTSNSYWKLSLKLVFKLFNWIWCSNQILHMEFVFYFLHRKWNENFWKKKYKQELIFF